MELGAEHVALIYLLKHMDSIRTMFLMEKKPQKNL